MAESVPVAFRSGGEELPDIDVVESVPVAFRSGGEELPDIDVDKTLPILFRGGGGLTPTYSWVDYVQGIGYQRFYGVGSIISSGLTYFLSTKAIDASSQNGIYTSGIAGADLDIDFDITFAIPSIVTDGKAYINASIYKEADAEAVMVVTIYHVSGVTETSLGTTTGLNRTGAASHYYRECIPVTLTRKKFAVGDKLRVTIQLNNVQTHEIRLYHDPTSSITLTDQQDRSIGTDLTIDIPFKVDI
jgi:hypothetical protein